VTNPEFVQPLPKCLEPLGPDQIDPTNRQNMTDRRVKHHELEIGQVINEAFEGNASVVGLERLGCPRTIHRTKLPGHLKEPNLS